MESRQHIEASGRPLRVSNLDKLLWPAARFSKRDMLAYYEAVAPALLPHLAGRPVTLARFPEGVEARGWYQTNCPAGQPDWLRIACVAGKSGQLLRYCVIDEPAALLWAANAGALELHPFLATAEGPDAPLALVFDLDPGRPVGLPECCAVALKVREWLERRSLRALAKTSGAKGVHVVVPLDGSASFVQTKAFARAAAREMAEALPQLVTDRMARATVCRELSLKDVHFGALDELAVRQHTRHGVVDSAAETAALSGHIDERNRSLFNPRVLIHVRP